MHKNIISVKISLLIFQETISIPFELTSARTLKNTVFKIRIQRVSHPLPEAKQKWHFVPIFELNRLAPTPLQQLTERELGKRHKYQSSQLAIWGKRLQANINQTCTVAGPLIPSLEKAAHNMSLQNLPLSKNLSFERTFLFKIYPLVMSDIWKDSISSNMEVYNKIYLRSWLWWILRIEILYSRTFFIFILQNDKLTSEEDRSDPTLMLWPEGRQSERYILARMSGPFWSPCSQWYFDEILIAPFKEFHL